MTMKMYTLAANDMREIQSKVNELGLSKDQIVNVLQTADGTYLLVYYGE